MSVLEMSAVLGNGAMYHQLNRSQRSAGTWPVVDYRHIGLTTLPFVTPFGPLRCERYR